jgi:DNA-binding transcriptional MerR regulator
MSGTGRATPATSAARDGLPSKLYFRIGEVAELVGVEPHVLRYWEREFRSVRPTKSAKGQRVYSRRDVENLMRVRELLYKEGFTIAGAKKRLQRSGVEPDNERAGVEPDNERAGVEPDNERAGLEPDHEESGAGLSDEQATEAAQQEAGAGSARDASGVEPAQIAQTDVARDTAKAREHLLAMRADIERFLAELGPARR